MTHQAFLLLGSNVGDRARNLQLAMAALAVEPNTAIQHSPVFETAAWGKEDQQSFYNTAVMLQTTLPPMALLEYTAGIEQAMGRQRAEKWGARTLDIDILFYDDLVLQDAPVLVIPHPLLQERRFALAPLAAIAPDLHHPVLGKTIAELLEACTDPLPVTALPQ